MNELLNQTSTPSKDRNRYLVSRRNWSVQTHRYSKKDIPSSGVDIPESSVMQTGGVEELQELNDP